MSWVMLSVPNMVQSGVDPHNRRLTSWQSNEGSTHDLLTCGRPICLHNLKMQP